MKQMLKLGLTLAAFAVAMCFLLALVNNITAPAIAENNRKKTEAAMRAVFAEADSFEQVTDFLPPDSRSIVIDGMYLAKKGDDVIGIVTRAEGPTYDRSALLVGQDLHQIISGVEILSTGDSPGYGQKSIDPNYLVASGKTFPGQFAGKNVADGFVVNQTFDAISGSTITSTGIANILSVATYAAAQYLATHHGGAAVGDSAPELAAPGLSLEPDASVMPFELMDAVMDIAAAADIRAPAVIEIPEGRGDIIRSMIVDRQYAVQVNGTTLAVAVAVSGQTYHDGGTVLTVVDRTRTILGARIISLNDSLHYGQKTLQDAFYRQFDNLPLDEDILNGSSYDAVTGASITSDCIADMVKVGGMRAGELMAERGGQAVPQNADTYQLNEHYLEE
ncbi:MAG: FMN-binding protein [Treponema sp.]|nr:FMN-binding protein [Treponema sp.]